jgi:hypothetical protein
MVTEVAWKLMKGISDFLFQLAAMKLWVEIHSEIAFNLFQSRIKNRIGDFQHRCFINSESEMAD